MNALILEVESGFRDAPAVTTPVLATPTPAPSVSVTHSSSSLHLELPHFDGDPFKWGNFATMFRATIKARAKGHSKLEVKGHLLKAVKHPAGLKLLHNVPSDDLDLDALLKLLEDKFGSAEVLAPLIISKIQSVSKFDLTAGDVDNVHDSFILPFQRFVSVVGDSLGSYLAMMLVGMMNPECKREWLRHKAPDTPPSMEAITTFVKYWQREFAAEDVSSSLTPPTKPHAPVSVPYPSSRSSSPTRNSKLQFGRRPAPRRGYTSCPVCQDNHILTRCPTFSGYTVDKRNKTVRDKRLCLNCFQDGHGCKQCPSRFSCRSCGGKHHTMLHRDGNPEHADASPSHAPAAPVLAATQQPAIGRNVRFLYSAIVKVASQDTVRHARALLDGGASIPLITEHLARDMQLDLIDSPTHVSGIGGTSLCTHLAKATVSAPDGPYRSEPLAFTVISKLDPLLSPSNKESLLTNPEFCQYKLADPELGGRVDLVLGIEQTSALTTGKPFNIGSLTALPTKLGLCLSGPLDESVGTAVMTVAPPPSDLQSDLCRLWDLDRVPEAPTLSQHDLNAVSQFESGVNRVGGRYSISLPVVSDPPELGDTRSQALSRLYSNERSLEKRGKLPEFKQVVQEYLELGHAEKVPAKELKKKNCCYLPVHAVLKETSTTTKCRAVFDASARSSTGYCLNDRLLPGPNLYPPLPDVLIRFRCHNIGMSADISKMFREVLLNADERDWHRFLVRTKDGAIVDCRMLRLTFGVKSSPFLATQVLRTLAEAYSHTHPRAAAIVKRDFYVDDVLTGAKSTAEADAIRRELCDLLHQAGMTLRKWRTNNTDLKALIPPELLESEASTQALSTGPDAHKALGVHWNTQSDSLFVAIPDVSPLKTTVTKRKLASGAAGVFDVLGLFAPVVIGARLILQEAWRLGLPWDEEVPLPLQQKWNNWVEDLPIIHELPVARRICDGSDVHLHGFCDASAVAYGAVIYARCLAPDGTVRTSLVLAKARVLPTKPFTIPKAELTSAHMLAQVLAHVAQLLEVPFSAVHAWTDSMIVLYWLPKCPTQLNRFVANRIHSIRELLPDVPWRHVRTDKNPADLASRGSRARELSESSLWWNGPDWLRLPPEDWPPTILKTPPTPIYSISLKPSVTPSPSILAFNSYLTSICSSFHCLVRVLCFVYRFIHNCRTSSQDRTSGDISYDDVERAKSKLYHLSQLEGIPEAITAAEKEMPLPNGHALRRYVLRKSDAGHVVAYSRVRNPDAPNQPSHLCVLSVKSPITILMLQTLHRVYGHPGTSTLMTILASSYVIPGLRNRLKMISRTCVICQKALAQPLAYNMGMLPSSRTVPAPPFTITGVDFAGPVTIRVGHVRKPTYLNSYVVVFVCLTTKAVHLDLCESLSTEDFMAVLSRFVARRGCPARIFSDNGTNFVGAREEIRALQRVTESTKTREAISHFTTRHSIQWSHIPPRAPHFGGLWEAAVKSMKIAVKKISGTRALTWTEHYTVLTEAEAILNSRPLTPVTIDDHEEANYITAGHFLVGRPLLAPPSKLSPTGKLSNLKRWNLVQRTKEDIWKLWLGAYLASCAQRSKWLRPGHTWKKGDVVLLKDESFRTRDWPIACIVDLHPGDDGVSRAVTLRCRGRLYRRSTNRLVLLVSDDEERRNPQAQPDYITPDPRSMSGTELPDRNLIN